MAGPFSFVASCPGTGRSPPAPTGRRPDRGSRLGRTSGTGHESEAAPGQAVLPPHATVEGRWVFRGKMCHGKPLHTRLQGKRNTGQIAVVPRDSTPAAVAGSVHADVDVPEYFLHNKFGGYGIGQERIQFHGLGIVSACNKRVHSILHELLTNTSVFDMHQRFSHDHTSTTFYNHRKSSAALTSEKICMLPVSWGKAPGSARPRRPCQALARPTCLRSPCLPGPGKRRCRSNEPHRGTPARSARISRRPWPQEDKRPSPQG